MELQQTGKPDDAIAAFRKQLEITPTTRPTLKNLGLLLSQLGKDADARAELEASVALPPDTRKQRWLWRKSTIAWERNRKRKN